VKNGLDSFGKFKDWLLVALISVLCFMIILIFQNRRKEFEELKDRVDTLEKEVYQLKEKE
jgi:hypothetical protein